MRFKLALKLSECSVFFHERRPGLCVIAAGSLLEFALVNVLNFPVGRVDYYYLNPLRNVDLICGKPI